MEQEHVIPWLLEGDVSIQYQVHRDLLGENRPDLQNRIATEGWGKRFMDCRNPDGHWGMRFYHPKWTSSHYTLLDLKNLGMPPANPKIRETIDMIAQNERAPDGGIHPAGSTKKSDVCINGMFLNYACYFGIGEKKLETAVDFILSQRMPDGGFNCMLNRSGAVHSSLHSTISVLEGITEFEKNGYTYRLDDLKRAAEASTEFVLKHRLFRSDKTGKIIRPDFLRFPYPTRWKYDILRALDHFRHSGTPFDERMRPAIAVLLEKRNNNGTWNVNAKYPGRQHFEMEKAGGPSRWNTLRALRILKKYGNDPVIS